MATLREAADDFLAQRRIAVAGVARDGSTAGNADCAAAGVPRAWLHRGIGNGSYSDDAVEAGRAAGVEVIPGACPCMFAPAADPFHRCLRGVQRARGVLPREVEL